MHSKSLNTLLLAVFLAGSLATCKDSSTAEKETDKEFENCGDNFKDIDGNSYKTVQIGGQCWMAENLKTGKYRNGSAIPNITDPVEWANSSSGT